MTALDFSRLQDRLGLNDDSFAEALGLTGRSRARSIQRWKVSGPPPDIATKAKELER